MKFKKVLKLSSVLLVGSILTGCTSANIYNPMVFKGFDSAVGEGLKLPVKKAKKYNVDIQTLPYDYVIPENIENLPFNGMNAQILNLEKDMYNHINDMENRMSYIEDKINAEMQTIAAANGNKDTVVREAVDNFIDGYDLDRNNIMVSMRNTNDSDYYEVHVTDINTGQQVQLAVDGKNGDIVEEVWGGVAV